MKVALVEHRPHGKRFWFNVPSSFEDVDSLPGKRVICDTAKRGEQYGRVICVCEFANEFMARNSMLTEQGATFPLRDIVAVLFGKDEFVDDIEISPDFARHTPRNEKLSRRFLEYFHDRKFHTPVILNEEGTLVDGYSAYLVAKTLNLKTIHVSRLVRAPKDVEEVVEVV